MNMPRNETTVVSEHRMDFVPQTSTSGSWSVPGRKADPIGSLRAHRKLALGLIFGLLVVGAVVALILAPRTYRAEVMIRVTPTYVASLSLNSEVRFDSNVEYHDYVEEQIYEIGNYATAVRALELLGPDRDLFQAPNETERRAAERLTALLSVHAVTDSYLIAIGLESSKPDAAAKIVNAVAQAYLDRHGQQEQDLNRKRMQELAEHRSQLEEQIKSRSTQLDQIAQELRTSSFDPKMGNPYDKMRDDASEALDHAKHDYIRAQAHFEALQAEQARLKNVELGSAAEQLLTTDTALAESTTELEKQREATFLELRGLAPSHPGRKALEAKIADINAELERVRGSSLDRLHSMLQQKRDTTALQEVAAAQARVEEVRQEQTGFEAQVASLDQKGSWFAAKYNQGLTLQAGIQSDQKEIQDIESRLNSVLTEAHTPGVVQLDAWAQVPDFSESEKRQKIAILFGIIALLAGIGIPSLIDLKDRRIKSLAELEALVGIPALGVAELDGTVERGHSRDALRRIALAIIREWRSAGSRVFLLTSVAKGGGTTSLTFALARELSLLGPSSIALEANFVSPDPRYRQQPPPNGSGTPARANGTLDHPNDKLSPTLPCSPEIALRLMKPLIDEQLTTFDIILLDTAPLLQSADTEMLIQMPAATILLVKMGRDHVDDILSAAKMIERISPPVVGTVLISGTSIGLLTDQVQTVSMVGTPIERFGDAAVSPSLISEALAHYDA